MEKLFSSYYPRLIALTGFLALAIVAYNSISSNQIPVYGWGGLFFLAALNGLVHHFTHGRKVTDQNKAIRRMMAGSMMRMLFTIAFLAITLFSFHPVSISFVIFYGSCFIIFLLFEISQIRRKLRPDFNAR
jgi:hypothetical protein